MPSNSFQQVVALVGTFIGPEKAQGLVSRQLKYCNKTEDSFVLSDVGGIVVNIVAAASLYLGDATKKDELKAKLVAMG
jgi:hypothetical protein